MCMEGYMNESVCKCWENVEMSARKFEACARFHFKLNRSKHLLHMT